MNALNAPSKLISKKQPLIFLIGPTASGKTDVVAELSKLLKIEAIICDSMQVYKHIPILSQAPSKEDCKQIAYHLNETLNLDQEFNASKLINECTSLIPKIRSNDCIPVIIGGTGLYYTTLMDGLCDAPPEDIDFRNEMNQRLKEFGPHNLYAELIKKDEQAAKKLHPNDSKRIIRALEVFKITGKKFSDIQPIRKGFAEQYSAFVFGLKWDRQILYDRINQRVDQMIERGAVQEVQLMQQTKLSRTAAQCLGYKEIKSYISKEIKKEKAVDDLKKHTRHFAKRQLTWFRRDGRIKWIQMQEKDPASAAQELFKQFQTATGVIARSA